MNEDVKKEAAPEVRKELQPAKPNGALAEAMAGGVLKTSFSDVSWNGRTIDTLSHTELLAAFVELAKQNQALIAEKQSLKQAFGRFMFS